MRALTATLLLAVSPSVTAVTPPLPVTRVAVEVFGVAHRGNEDGLAFTRQEGPLENGENPDARARQLVDEGRREVALIHSTSWRWERDGRIVLTYVAWVKEGTLGPAARPLPRLKAPGPVDPLRPRPAEIRELDPLAHGLRHFAFLLRTSRDGAMARALGPAAVAALQKLEPEVAGELSPE
jgi:hypothetical protein